MSITGERIKKRRKETGISADDIAYKLGLSRSTIFRYESGKIEKVPANVIESLAAILQTTPAYLMGWTNDSQNQGQIADDKGDSEDWLKMKIDFMKAPECNSFINYEYAAKNDAERRLLNLYRKAGELPPEEKESILKNFEATMDMYLIVKGNNRN